MASVSSLDKDLRKVRLDKFTPAAANEARVWIEESLGEKLPSSDLLEGLRDGVALCKLVNLLVPRPGVKYKQSAMPFVQMENISIFLRACQAAPLNLHQHDTFLTVDLYEQKDPAQVLQCLGAFSRAANAINPHRFPSVIGPRIRGGSVVSPQATGGGGGGGPVTPSSSSRGRGISITSNTSHTGSRPSVLAHQTGDSVSGRRSPTKSPTPNNGPGSPGAVSSWSRREHEGATSPAWNIAQYGYMGGASQGNLGIAFGARRQITSAGPSVPNMAEKERLRREREAEEERLLAEEQRRKAELEEEERLARLEEERKWEEETRRLRDEERRKADEEKRRWDEEEREWKLTEERRRREEEEAATRLDEERQRTRSRSDARLRGQFLSQYQAEQSGASGGGGGGDGDKYSSRIKELEKELELARQREAEYERERQGRPRPEARDTPQQQAKARARSRSRPADATPSRQDSWSRDEREVLQTEWNRYQQTPHGAPSGKPAVSSPLVPSKSPRPLPDPTATPPIKPQNTGGRPLPDPAAYKSPPRPVPTPPGRADRFHTEQEAASPAPAPAPAPSKPTYSREVDATAERDAEDRRRQQSQVATKAGGRASKSLLEREMELERQRQQEWEEAQKETAAAARAGDGVDGIGGGIGGKWDVNQWTGFTGGDSQNRGTQGIGAGRRQIVGPRPLPGTPK